MEDILEEILDFFDLCGDVIDFAIQMIEDSVYVIDLCASFVAKVPSYFSWLPSAAVSMIVTIFGIVVVYKVLGREG